MSCTGRTEDICTSRFHMQETDCGQSFIHRAKSLHLTLHYALLDFHLTFWEHVLKALQVKPEDAVGHEPPVHVSKHADISDEDYLKTFSKESDMLNFWQVRISTATTRTSSAYKTNHRRRQRISHQDSPKR